MSGGSCWSQQNSIDINESRRPSEDSLPPMYHHLHAIFKEHQIMSPIKEISSTNQQQTISGQVLADESIDQLENELASEEVSIAEYSPNTNVPVKPNAPGPINQYSKNRTVYTAERANSSASLFTQPQTNEMEERRASLSLLINCNKQQQEQLNRLSPQQYSHVPGHTSGKSRTRPSSPKKYAKHYSRCESLSKLNNQATILSATVPLSTHSPSTRYRSSVTTGKKSATSTTGYLPTSTNLPASGGGCVTKSTSANSRRNQWRRKRPMSLDTVLMKTNGNKGIREAPSEPVINNRDQW